MASTGSRPSASFRRARRSSSSRNFATQRRPSAYVPRTIQKCRSRVDRRIPRATPFESTHQPRAALELLDSMLAEARSLGQLQLRQASRLAVRAQQLAKAQRRWRTHDRASLPPRPAWSHLCGCTLQAGAQACASWVPSNEASTHPAHMEPIGSHFAVLLHDRQLRGTLTADSQADARPRSVELVRTVRAVLRTRLSLTMLRSVAQSKAAIARAARSGPPVSIVR